MSTTTAAAEEDEVFVSGGSGTNISSGRTSRPVVVGGTGTGAGAVASIGGTSSSSISLLHESRYSSSSSSSPVSSSTAFVVGGGGRAGGLDRLVKKAASILSTSDESSSSFLLSTTSGSKSGGVAGRSSASTTANGSNNCITTPRNQPQQQEYNQQRNYHHHHYHSATDASPAVSPPVRQRRAFFSSDCVVAVTGTTAVGKGAVDRPNYSSTGNIASAVADSSTMGLTATSVATDSSSGGGGGGNGQQHQICSSMSSAAESSSTMTTSSTITRQSTTPAGGVSLCAAPASSSPTSSSSANHHYYTLQYHHHQQRVNRHLLYEQQLQLPSRGGDKSPLRSSLIKDGTRRSPSCKKTVSFSSMPAEKKISNVADCLVYMQNGCELIKVRSSTRRYRRRFTLDTDCSNLRWSPTNKKPHKAKIAIETIREVRLGRNTENLRNSDSCFEELTEDCAFSVIWGDDYQSLDLIAGTPDEANIWVTGLMALTSGSAPIAQQLDALHAGAPTLRDRWLEESFRQVCEEEHSQGKKFTSPITHHQEMNGQKPYVITAAGFPAVEPCTTTAADETGSSSPPPPSLPPMDISNLLDESGVLKLVKRINPLMPSNRIKMKIKEFDPLKPEGAKGWLSCEEFCEMYKDIATRPEIYFLMVRYANKDYLTTDDLQVFLETEQGMVGVTKELCQGIMERHEPSEMGRRQHCMTVDGFTAYLQSLECDLLDSTHHRVCQDMSQPLNHYFINASYGTYLLDDQVKGLCSAEGYIRALKWGCRYLELDLWEAEGYEEPVISHGSHGTAGKLPVSKALNAIRAYAFETSQYPLILQLEVHLDVKMQRLLVEMIKESLSDYIFSNEIPTVDKLACLPSPEQLKKKILFKSRKCKGEFGENGIGEVSDDEEAADGNKSHKASKKTGSSKKRALCKELSALISPYLVTCSFKDLQKALAQQEAYELCSLNESAAMRLAAHATDAFVIYTRRFLTRIFPNSIRVDSSNFNPQEFWNCGCQIASLNVQTQGLMTDLVKGKFLANGGCGYVLKPMVMRDEQSFFSPRDCLPTLTPQTLHLKVISAHLLPRPRGSTAKGDSLDPFIILEVFGVPADCAEERTKTVRNDGYNPVFDESFQFDINVPELTLIRFLVLDDDFIGDDFIGQYTVPFDCLLSGYRHITLLNCDGEPIEGTTIFLHVAITNKRGGGKAKKRGMSVRRKRSRVSTGIKLLGVKQVDDMFKAAIPIVSECVELRQGLEGALNRWQESCGVGPATTIRQGLRLMYARLIAANGAPTPTTDATAASATGTPAAASQAQATNAAPAAAAFTLEVWLEEGYPCIELRGSSVPEVLRKSCDHFQRVLLHCKAIIERSDPLTSKLEEIHRRLSESYEELLAGFDLADQSPMIGGSAAANAALRGQRASRASENFAWNLRLMKAQLDMMGKLQNEARDYLKQVQDTACLLGVLRDQCQQPCAHRSLLQANSI